MTGRRKLKFGRLVQGSSLGEAFREVDTGSKISAGGVGARRVALGCLASGVECPAMAAILLCCTVATICQLNLFSAPKYSG